MQPFWEIVASNAVLVVVLAAGVALLGWVWKNPLCLHLLWVLVLLKLVTPPVVTVPIALPTKQISLTSVEVVVNQRLIGHVPRLNDRAISESPVPNLSAATSGVESQRIPWFVILGWTWSAGIVLLTFGHAYRIFRFRRLFHSSQSPPVAVLNMAEGIAKRLGLRQAPDIRMLPVCVSPLVWSLGGRPRVFLPSALFERLDAAAQEAILAHELAHVRRKDHWVRLLEVAITTLFWWHPVVWWAARQLQELEDQCCDAMVVDLAPHGAKSYATALLDTLDFLCERSIVAPLGATAAKSSISLTRRIAMLKNRSWTARLTLGRLALVLIVAALPMTVAFGQKQSKAIEQTAPAVVVTQDVNKDATSAGTLQLQTTSEFPYVVRFEQGVTRFEDGDKITIVEVRGTADTFKPGNIYWIKGTYTLASHDKASLDAYVTATNTAEGTGVRTYHPQKTKITRGSGTFTLFLPMLYQGWPHVSFYPANGGEGFGGNYFGTGDFVLKRWWGSEESSTSQTPDYLKGAGHTTFTVGHFDKAGWEMLQKQEPYKHQNLYGRWPMTDEYNKALKNDTKPGDTVIALLSLHDLPGVSEEVSDLLLLPRSEIESRLKQGQTVFKQGTVRGMNVFLVATPTFDDMGKEFRRLIAEDKFALDKEAATK